MLVLLKQDTSMLKLLLFHNVFMAAVIVLTLLICCIC